MIYLKAENCNQKTQSQGNGSGKTTALSLISRVYKPHRGKSLAKILLLDEPTKGLDGCFKETLAELLKN